MYCWDYNRIMYIYTIFTRSIIYIICKKTSINTRLVQKYLCKLNLHANTTEFTVTVSCEKIQTPSLDVPEPDKGHTLVLPHQLLTYQGK